MVSDDLLTIRDTFQTRFMHYLLVIGIMYFKIAESGNNASGGEGETLEEMLLDIQSMDAWVSTVPVI